MDDTAPSLFGFRVTTDLPLRFLRGGGGVDPLAIVCADGVHERPQGAPLGEWPLHGTAYPAHASLHQVPNGFEYWTSDAGRFAVDLTHGRIEIPVQGDEILREQRLNGMPMLLAFAHRGDFSLHAAAVRVGDGAVILTGPSGFGKTTLAFACHERGLDLLCEDLVCVRPSTNALFPGPALARLRPDVWTGTAPEGMEVVAERPDRIFLRPTAARHVGAGPLPIRGICFLRQGESIRLTPANLVDAARDLWHVGFRFPTAEARAASFQQLTRLAGAVPVWNFERPMRLDALDATVAALVEAAG